MRVLEYVIMAIWSFKIPSSHGILIVDKPTTEDDKKIYAAVKCVRP